jgi:hypothetical protein
MGYGIAHIKKEVKKKVTEEVVTDMINWVTEHEINLWGLEKGRKTFIEEIVYLTLFKYIENIGYSALWKSVSKKINKGIGFIPESEKTLRVDNQRMRSTLKHWSEKWIHSRGFKAVDVARTQAVLKSHVMKCQLLIYSQDVRICKDNDAPLSALDDCWSDKLGDRAQRFMVRAHFKRQLHF